MISGKKNLPGILKKKENQFIDKQEKAVLALQILNRNREKLCLETFCNFSYYYRHINL